MKHALRADLPPLPPTLKHAHIDARGYPVPFFVAWIKGAPDHRIIEPIKLKRCVKDQLCWICGKPLTRPIASVIGPMCGVNHISAEPPSHEACSRYSISACPFLSKPKMRRRRAGWPGDDGEPLQTPAGHMIERNPGVMLLWFSDQVHAFVPKGYKSWLFDLGEPLAVEWWTEGRRATREEAEAAIAAGLPLLYEASPEPEARAEIDAAAAKLRLLLPSP